MVIHRLAVRAGRKADVARILLGGLARVRAPHPPKYIATTTTTTTTTGRQYTDKHEWVEVSGNVGTVGITNYAQEALGDVVYAQLPDAGTVLQRADECGALESVKAASEIYSPVSGTVTEKNREVESAPSLINTSCYEKGWLFKIELADQKEIAQLMDENKYDEFVKSNAH